jgi:hypothetical protein
MELNTMMKKYPIQGMLLLCLALLPLGCQPPTDIQSRSAAECSPFQVAKVYLQPAFTKAYLAKSGLSGDGYIEACVELRDQFGDPIKAPGKFRFEIFKYRPAFADPRGKRFALNGIQIVDLENIEINQQHWNPITRSYKMTLQLPDLSRDASRFVLQVTFSLSENYRLQDLLTLEFEK